MGVRLDREEIEEFLTDGHTLILATIRKSGAPFMTPLWYAFLDGAIYFRTKRGSAKVAHILRDPRVCCLVEEGENWIDLKAVIMNGRAEAVEGDPLLWKRFYEEMDRKYAAFRPQPSSMPVATRNHYSGSWGLVKVTPDPGEVRSWYNRKIRGNE
jgi:nitroimidazol reductase NimA-like FMN-containing flavoprotein (pyridoxamine 5'-phosphate oxidase superfamily)